MSIPAPAARVRRPATVLTALGLTLAAASCGIGSAVDPAAAGGPTAPVTAIPGTPVPVTAGPTPSAAGGGDLPQGSEPVTLDPANFTTDITNPYWPMTPGSVWEYVETNTEGSREEVTVTVTTKTKKIANGITARVIRDEARANGELTEATDDWYAQDQIGNIWYLGEATAEYQNGKVSKTAGSFEAGVDGAQPGIAMPANPVAGMSYRQEYLAGVAEDRGAVGSVGLEQVQVPFGFFDKNVLMTRDLVPLEPKVQELKFFAPGVGPVLSVHLDGVGGRSELIKYTQG